MINEVMFFLLPGYLSCCRFLDDNQIVTSSGDTTWWVVVFHPIAFLFETTQELHAPFTPQQLLSFSYNFVLFPLMLAWAKNPSSTPKFLVTEVKSRISALPEPKEQ